MKTLFILLFQAHVLFLFFCRTQGFLLFRSYPDQQTYSANQNLQAIHDHPKERELTVNIL